MVDKSLGAGYDNKKMNIHIYVPATVKNKTIQYIQNFLYCEVWPKFQEVDKYCTILWICSYKVNGSR